MFILADEVSEAKFAEKLQLPKTLKKVISIERGPTADYKVANVIMMLMMGVLAGIKHISHLEILRTDSVIRKLFSWEKFPDNRTFGRLFELFNHKHCNELHKAEQIAQLGKKFGQRNGLDV